MLLSIICTQGKELKNDFYTEYIVLQGHLCFSGEICVMQKKATRSVFRMLGLVFWDGGFPFYSCLCYQHKHMRPTFFVPPETTSPLNSDNGFCSSDDHRKGRSLRSAHSTSQLLLTPVGHIINFDRHPVENTK